MSAVEICGLCEVAPTQADDVMCGPCRDWVIDNSMVVTDPVEKAIAKHMPGFPTDFDSTTCRCGETFEGGPGFHRRHLAEMIHAVLGLDGPLPWLPAREVEELLADDES